jgi:acyl transferase domain-containing protein
MGQKSGDKGSMLAVQGDLNLVRQVMEEERIELVIANKNSPQQTVLSGATREVERAANVLKAREIRCKHLNVAAAFHSAFVADASGTFLEALKQTDIDPPTLPVYADSTAGRYPEDLDRIRELLAGQLANPVDFIGIIENMYASGVRTFCEVGPSSQMNGLIKAILEGRG